MSDPSSATEKMESEDFWDAYVGQEYGASPTLVRFAELALERAPVAPGSRILDVATGTGGMALVAARAGLQVVTVDFSAGMVDRVRAYGIPGIATLQMDGQILEFEDSSFDSAFSMFGVSLFPDWRAGLSEMMRVVRPLGRVCIGAWKDPHGAAGALLLSRVCGELFPGMPIAVDEESGDGQYVMRDQMRFAGALRQAGAVDVEVHEVSADFYVDLAVLADPERYFTFSNLWTRLDTAEQSAVCAYLQRRVIQQDGPVPIPTPALVGVGMKPEK